MFAVTEGVRRAMSLSSSWNPGSLAGPLLAPSSLLVALLVLPALAVVLARLSDERAAARAVATALGGCAAVAAYLGARLWGGGAPVALVQPLWRVLAVQQLELTVGLALDGPAAVALLGLALLGGWAVSGPGRRQAVWVGGLYAAAALALLGDSLVLRLAGWELLTVAGWGLGARRRLGPVGLARAADATLLLASVFLFWALAGSWSSSRLDSRYQLDHSPPAAAEGAGTAAPEPGPTLQLHPLHHQLHGASGDGAAGSPVRAALANKLGPGARLLTWLVGLFVLAAALKAGSGALQLFGERVEQGQPRPGRSPGSSLAVRLLLAAGPLAAGWSLLWRLR